MARKTLLATWLALATISNAQFDEQDSMVMPMCVQDCLTIGFIGPNGSKTKPLCTGDNNWDCYCSEDGIKDIWQRAQPCLKHKQLGCAIYGDPGDNAYASSIFSAKCIASASTTVTIRDYAATTSATSTPTSTASKRTTVPIIFAPIPVQTPSPTTKIGSVASYPSVLPPASELPPASWSPIAVFVPQSVVSVITVVSATPVTNTPTPAPVSPHRPSLPPGYPTFGFVQVAHEEQTVAAVLVAPSVIVVAPAAVIPSAPASALAEVQLVPGAAPSATAMAMADMTMPSPAAAAALSHLAEVASAISLQSFNPVATPAAVDHMDMNHIASSGSTPAAAVGQNAASVPVVGSTIDMLMPMPDMATYSSTDAVARPAGVAQSGAVPGSHANTGASAMSGNGNSGMVMAGPSYKTGSTMSTLLSFGPPQPGTGSAGSSSDDYATYSDGPGYSSGPGQSSGPAGSASSYTGGASSQGSRPSQPNPNSLPGVMGGYSPTSYKEPGADMHPPYGMPYAGADGYEDYDGSGAPAGGSGAPASGSGWGYRPAVYRGSSASGAARQTDSAAIVALAAGLVAALLI